MLAPDREQLLRHEVDDDDAVVAAVGDVERVARPDEHSARPAQHSTEAADRLAVAAAAGDAQHAVPVRVRQVDVAARRHADRGRPRERADEPGCERLRPAVDRRKRERAVGGDGDRLEQQAKPRRAEVEILVGRQAHAISTPIQTTRQSRSPPRIDRRPSSERSGLSAPSEAPETCARVGSTTQNSNDVALGLKMWPIPS